uniref:SCP domain-containing protein n=1 Tax=Mesocestoides corti TaxID=53468 RepID=A0A5K3F7M4_MESCO
MRTLIYLVALIWSATAEVPTPEQRKEILELHTNLRESVQPHASNMMLMTYSTELEAITYNWIANCSFITPHPDTLPGDVVDIGEDVEDGMLTIVEMVKRFASEKRFYNYDRNRCTEYCYNYKHVSESV